MKVRKKSNRLAFISIMIASVCLLVSASDINVCSGSDCITIPHATYAVNASISMETLGQYYNESFFNSLVSSTCDANNMCEGIITINDTTPINFPRRLLSVAFYNFADNSPAYVDNVTFWEDDSGWVPLRTEGIMSQGSQITLKITAHTNNAKVKWVPYYTITKSDYDLLPADSISVYRGDWNTDWVSSGATTTTTTSTTTTTLPANYRNFITNENVVYNDSINDNFVTSDYIRYTAMWSSADSPYSAYLKVRSSAVASDPVAIVRGDYFVSQNPLDLEVGTRVPAQFRKGQSQVGVVSGDNITYADQYGTHNYADIEYQYGKNAIKERLVIKDGTYIAAECNSSQTLIFPSKIRAYKVSNFTEGSGLRVNFKGVSISENYNLSNMDSPLEVLDSNNQTIWSMWRPLAYDASNRQLDLNYSLEMLRLGDMRVNVEIPCSFFEGATYPVTIDPSWMTWMLSNETYQLNQKCTNTDGVDYCGYFPSGILAFNSTYTEAVLSSTYNRTDLFNALTYNTETCSSNGDGQTSACESIFTIKNIFPVEIPKKNLGIEYYSYRLGGASSPDVIDSLIYENITVFDHNETTEYWDEPSSSTKSTTVTYVRHEWTPLDTMSSIAVNSSIQIRVTATLTGTEAEWIPHYNLSREDYPFLPASLIDVYMGDWAIWRKGATPQSGGTEDGLLAKYGFDDLGGNVIKDSSGRNNDGTYYGMPLLTDPAIWGTSLNMKSSTMWGTLPPTLKSYESTVSTWFKMNKYDTANEQYFLGPNSPPLNWNDAAFSKRKSISINDFAGTLSNFPSFLNITYDSDMQADYDDLRFYSAPCGQSGGTLMYYDLETYTASSASVWLKHNLVLGQNTVCMYYGNSTVSTGEGVTGTWHTTYGAVYHMTTDRVDSTSNARNALAGIGTPTADNTLGNGLAFDGITQGWNLTDIAYFESAWNIRSHEIIFKTGSDVTTRQQIYGEGSASNGMSMYIVNGRLNAIWVLGAATTFVNRSVAISANTLYHAVAVYGEGSSTDNYYLMVQGSTGATGTPTVGVAAHSGNGGVAYANDPKAHHDSTSVTGAYFKGTIYEIHAVDSEYSTGWWNQSAQMILNQNQFVTQLAEETNVPVVNGWKSGIFYGIDGSTPNFRPYALMYNSSGTQCCGVAIDRDFSAKDEGVWYHYAVTYSKQNNRLRLYLNGTLQSSNACTCDPQYDFAQSMSFGRAWPGTNNANFTFDNMKIYGRELNSTEISNLYQPADPMLLYHMDESSGAIVADSSGYGTNMSFNGTVSRQTGVFGSAYSFDGTGADYGNTFANTSNIDWGRTVNGLRVFSISAWFKPTSDSGDIVALLGRTAGYNPHVIMRYQNLSSIGLALDVRDDSRLVDTYVATGGSVPGSCQQKNVWHHAVAVFNGTRVLLYCDGAYLNSMADAFGNITINKASIGARVKATVVQSNLGGLIDEVAVYKRALSDNEVTLLYRSGTSESQINSPGDGASVLTVDGSVPIDIGIGEGSDGIFNATYGANGVQNIIYDPNLVGYWTFNNLTALGESSIMAFDNSRMSNHATITGGVTYVAGKYGTAVRFPGGGAGANAVTVPKQLYYNGNVSFTLSFWLKGLGDYPGTQQAQAIIGQPSGQPIDGWGIMAGGRGDGRMYFVPYYGAGWWQISPSLPAIESDGWVQWTIVVNATRNFTTYKNGVQVMQGSLPAAYSSYPPTRDFTIGNGFDAALGVWSPFNGTIDNVMMWNRTVTAAEANALYKVSIERINSTNWKMVGVDNLSVGPNNVSVNVCGGDALLTCYSETHPFLLRSTNGGLNLFHMDDTTAGPEYRLVDVWSGMNATMQTIAGSGWWSSNQIGKLGTAIRMNRQSQDVGGYATWDNTTTLGPDNSECAWLKVGDVTQYGGTDLGFIFDVGQGNGLGQWNIKLYGAGLMAAVSNMSGAAGAIDIPASTANRYYINPNTWYHTCLTVNSTSKNATFYVNGAAYASFVGAEYPLNRPTFRKIGCSSDYAVNANPIYCFNGTIDEVRIYKRTLSGSEVNDLYRFTNPVASYDFEEGSLSSAGIFDTSTNEFNGVTVNNPTMTNSGISGKSITLSGLQAQAQYVNLFNPPSLLFQDTQPYTVSSWVKTKVCPAPTGYGQWIIGLGNNNPGSANYRMYLYSGNNNAFAVATNNSGSQWYYSTYTSTCPAVDTWNQLAFVYNSTHVYMYKNGIQTGYVTPKGLFYGSSVAPGVVDTRLASMNMTIGALFDSVTNYGVYGFNGSIDDVRVYNRPLTDSDMLNLYQNGAPGAYNIAPTLGTTLYQATLPAQVNVTSVLSTNNGFTNVTYAFNSSSQSLIYGQDLVGYWPMNNVSAIGESNSIVVDVSPYGLANLTPQNTTAYQWTTSNGKYGSGYKISSNPSDLAATRNLYTTNSIVRPTKGLSVGGWVKWDSDPGGTQSIVFGDTDGNKYYGFSLFSYRGNSVYFAVGNGTASSNEDGFSYSHGSNWHHYFATYDSTTGNKSIYVDGVLLSSAIRRINSIAYYGNNVVIVGGTNSVWAVSALNATFDEMMIWNRSVTGAEVNAIYQTGLMKFNQTNWQLIAPNTLSIGTDTASVTACGGVSNPTCNTASTWFNIASRTPSLVSIDLPVNNTQVSSPLSTNGSVIVADSSVGLANYTLTVAGTTVGYGPQSSSLSSGLVDLWHLDEASGSVVDKGSRANNLALQGSVTYGQAGVLGNSILFPGVVTNSNFFNGTRGNLPLTATNQDFTIVSWIKPKMNDTNHAECVLMQGNTTFPLGGGGFFFGTWSGKMYTCASNNSFGTYSIDWCINQQRVPENVWTMMTWRANSTHYILSTNGTSSQSVIARNNNNNMYILGGTQDVVTLGASNDVYITSSQNFNGTIDEVRVYSRTLSDAELQDLYAFTSPIASYHFDETSGSIIDSTNSGFTGIADGTSTYSQAGAFGSAIQFNKASNFTLSGTSSYNMPQQTIGFWFKGNPPKYLCSSSDEIVFSKGFDAYTTNFALAWCNNTAVNNTASSLLYWRGNATGGVGGFAQAVSSYIQPGTWHHIALVSNDTRQMIYLDGILNANVAAPQSQYLDTHSITIGSDSKAGSVYGMFGGTLDDLNIWSRALSASEIAAMAKLLPTTGSYGPQSNGPVPTHAYRLDETTGTYTDYGAGGLAKEYGKATGTVVGTVTRTNEGHLGNSITTSAVNTNSYINVTSLDFALQNFTVSMWFKSNGAKEEMLMGAYERPDGGDYGWYMYKFADGRVGLYPINQSGYNTYFPYNINLFGGYNVWHHVVSSHSLVDGVTYDSICMDGTCKSQTVNNFGTVRYYTAAGGVGIAAPVGWTSATPFNGSIDEVKFFDRALTVAEMQSIYNGPDATYHLDETLGTTVTDSSGGNYNGVNRNSTTINTPGIFGSSYTFPGVNQFVSISDFPRTDNMSYSFWLKLANNSAVGMLFENYLDATGNDGIEVRQRPTGDISVSIYARGAGGYNLFDTNLLNNTWYHVGISVGQTNTASGTKIDMYLNGTLHSSQYSAINITQSNKNVSVMYVGASASGANVIYPLNGQIDEINIWHRALNASEMSALSSRYTANTQFYSLSSIDSISPGTIPSGTGKNVTLIACTVGNGCYTQTNYFTVSAPQVFVHPMSNQNPIQNSIALIGCNFTAQDFSPVISSAKCVFTKAGETTRQNITGNCGLSSSNMSCSIGMQYYDGAGTWNINASASDGINTYYSDISTFDYNTLLAMDSTPSSIGFNTLDPLQVAGSTDDPVIIYNQGNVQINNVSIKAYNLNSTNNIVSATNFNVTATDLAGTGATMQNDTYRQIPTLTISKGSGASSNMYVWVKAPNAIMSTYRSQSDWVITTQ